MDAAMEQFQHLKIKWEDITSATNNFDQENLIGHGGFGNVYKGALARIKEHSVVALKRLDRKYGQGDTEFLKEIMFLSQFTHENVISLLGFCNQEKEMILVYEYASRGSLDCHLSAADLTWIQRLKICHAAAKGLEYLHDPKDTSQRLIHCDIKSANILLDDQWNAKVADFGLSKFAPANQQYSMLVTDVLGTIGYCDPLFMETYSLTKESDVYSFGVVLLEVLCGRVCSQISNGQIEVLVPMWKNSYKENRLDEIIFPGLRQTMDPHSLRSFSEIAFQCVEEYPVQRPKMSFVVERLHAALESQVRFQELQELEVLKLQKLELLWQDYSKIVNAGLPSVTCNSKEELKALLFKGFFINNGSSWVSMNDNEHYIQLTSIKECLIPEYKRKNFSDQNSHEYNSRFAVGTFDTRGQEFTTHIKSKILSPSITYTANLIFKCPDMLKKKSGKQQYISLTYEINEVEKKISIVYLGDKSEGEWLMARLHQFTTSDQSITDLVIKFVSHENSFQVEGIEFQPLPLEFNVEVEQDHELVMLDDKKYQEIVKSAEPPLIYRSVPELKLLISKGVLVNRGNTWFSLNDDGQHCELISIRQCIDPVALDKYPFVSKYNSRFIVGSCLALDCKFKIRVRAQFLTPLITYTANLVFKFYNNKDLTKQHTIFLKFKLKGQTTTSVSYLADKREDDWWMVELCEFTSQETYADLEIIFENSRPYTVVEGIEFLPRRTEKGGTSSLGG